MAILVKFYHICKNNSNFSVLEHKDVFQEYNSHPIDALINIWYITKGNLLKVN